MAKPRRSDVLDVLIKEGLPTVAEGRQRLLAAIEEGRAKGYRLLKLIHGYGSSGAGGALKDALRSSLRRRKKEGKIQNFIAGEEWSIFNEAVRQILNDFPQLDRDQDLNQGNEGVTLVLLKNL